MQFVKKTSLRRNILSLVFKLALVFIVILGVIFLLNKIEYPSPNKEIEIIIPNENFKIIK